MRTLLILALLSAPAHAGRRYCYPTATRVQKVYVQQSADLSKEQALDVVIQEYLRDDAHYSRLDAFTAMATGGGYGASASAQASGYVPPQGNTILGYETKIELRKPFDRDAYMARAIRYAEVSRDTAAQSFGDANATAQAFAGADDAREQIEAISEGYIQALERVQVRDATVTVTAQAGGASVQVDDGKITPPAITSLGSRLDGDTSLVQALFSQTCLSCHSGETTKGGVDLGGELTEELRMKAVYAVMRGRMPKGPDGEANPLPGPQRDALGAWLAGDN